MECRRTHLLLLLLLVILSLLPSAAAMKKRQAARSPPPEPQDPCEPVPAVCRTRPHGAHQLGPQVNASGKCVRGPDRTTQAKAWCITASSCCRCCCYFCRRLGFWLGASSSSGNRCIRRGVQSNELCGRSPPTACNFIAKTRGSCNINAPSRCFYCYCCR
jgi:hypothetical protein